MSQRHNSMWRFTYCTQKARLLKGRPQEKNKVVKIHCAGNSCKTWPPSQKKIAKLVCVTQSVARLQNETQLLGKVLEMLFERALSLLRGVMAKRGSGAIVTYLRQRSTPPRTVSLILTAHRGNKVALRKGMSTEEERRWAESQQWTEMGNTPPLQSQRSVTPPRTYLREIRYV